MAYDKADLMRRLKAEEEDVEHPYYDTADPPQLTVGIGHNLTAKGIPPEVLPLLHGFGTPTDLGYAWPQEARDKLLELDLEDAERELDALLPEWRSFPDAQQEAFMDLMFNMGPGTLSKFTHTLASARVQNWNAVAQGLRDSAWYGKVGVRGPKVIALILADAVANEAIA